MNARVALQKMRQAALDQRYTLTEHAYLEMDNDDLDALDVEATILTGAIRGTLTDDPRGPRFVVHGTACDQSTSVAVVGRFVKDDDLLIITVYEIK